MHFKQKLCPQGIVVGPWSRSRQMEQVNSSWEMGINGILLSHTDTYTTSQQVNQKREEFSLHLKWGSFILVLWTTPLKGTEYDSRNYFRKPLCFEMFFTTRHSNPLNKQNSNEINNNKTHSILLFKVKKYSASSGVNSKQATINQVGCAYHEWWQLRG